MDQFTAQYHLPGLFEFYALYRLFLPLFFEHREYFYDWCGIGSIYGAPEGCLWGGGTRRLRRLRPARRACPAPGLRYLRPPDVQQFPAGGRSTWPNPRCNTLCRLFESSGENGIIVHSDLLVVTCGALSGAVSRLVHDKGPDGLLCVPSGAGAAGVSVCRAGFPPESGAGAAARPLAAGEGEGRIPVQRMLPLRLPGPPRVL